MEQKPLFSKNKKKLLAAAGAVIGVGIPAAIAVVPISHVFSGGVVYGYGQIPVDNEDESQTLFGFEKDADTIYTPLVTNGASELTLTVLKGTEAYDSLWLAVETMDGSATVYESELCFEEDEDRIKIALSDLTEESYCLYVRVETEDRTIAYLSTIADFVAAAEAGDGQELVLLEDLEGWTEDVVITNAQIWDLNDHTLTLDASLHFVSEEEGQMCICNEQDSLQCKEVLCETPLWEYEITSLFGNFNETEFYYINAKSVNGADVDRSALYIDASEKLDRYITDGAFDTALLPEETQRIVFSGTFEIAGFDLNAPVDLTFTGDISVNGTVYAEFTDEDAWNIDTEANETSLAEAIAFETPNAEVTWTGENGMEYSRAEQYMNFASYNGQERSEYIGGAGKGILESGSLLAESDDWIAFTIDGNYLSLTISYINNVDMDDTQVSAVWKDEEDCTAEIIKDGEDYYCVTTDSEGGTRGYKILLTSKEYQLPVIYITTDSGASITSQTTYQSATFSLDYNGTEEYADIEDAEINIRGRGHSSWKLDKKPYKIKFEDKTSLFGLTAAKEWCLLANQVDYSLIRNTLAMEMAAELDNFVFVPTSHMVDVFVNGEYVGVYSICEQIEMKDGRLPGEKDSTEIDCDYLLEMGGDEETTSFGNNVFATTLCTWETVNTPDEDVLSEEQYNYIRNYMQELDDAIISGEGYEEYIDVPSLVDYFILLEFSYNLDGAFRRSNFMLKKAGDKLYMASPWDYDYAFGNMTLDTDTYDDWISLGNTKTDNYNEYITTNWMDYLLEDDYFIEQLKLRWDEVGETLYLTALETIDELEVTVTPSAEDNFVVWDILGTRTQYQSRQSSSYATYAEQMQYLRDFIENRYAWMDKTIRAM